MDRRAELDEILREIVRPYQKDNKLHVFFQPSSSVLLTYPCIIYKLSKIDTRAADNLSYIKYKRYSVTVIDRNPDSKIPDKVLDLPMCSFDRFYTADNLNHWNLELYY